MIERPRMKRGDDADDAEVIETGDTTGEDRDVDSLIAELGGEGGYVQLRRWEAGSWVILDRLDISEATADAIKAKYGGGKYRARIHDEAGTPGKQVTFKIAGKPKNPDEEGDAKTELAARLDRLERMIAARADDGGGGNQNKLLDAVVARLLTAPTTPPRDPLIGDLITALIAGKPNTSVLDPLKLQELLMQAEERGEKRGRELGEALSIASGEGDGVAAVLAKTLPSIAETFGKAVGDAQRVRANPPRAAVRPVEQTPAPGGEEVPANKAVAEFLRPVVPTFVKWAKAGKSAEVKAANVVDDLTDEQRDRIGVYAEQDSFVEDIIAAIPEFQHEQVREWFVLFFGTIRDMLTEVAEDAGDGSGVAPDTTGQGATGT